jgi:hypothetical protein
MDAASIDERLARGEETVDVQVGYRYLVPGGSRSASYAAAGRGELPTLRVGRRLVVPLRQLRARLNGERG